MTTVQVSGSFTGVEWSASAPEVYANIWQELGNNEAANFIAFLHSQKDLNLTAVVDAERQILIVFLSSRVDSDCVYIQLG